MYHNNPDSYKKARLQMTDRLASSGAVHSGAVLRAIASVPRHLFVSEALRFRAYEDTSLPVGYGQTISKPSTIARMVQSLGLSGGESVLEIGTGTGYQAAVLSILASRVVSVERIEALYKRAQELLLFHLNLHTVTLIHGEDLAGLEGLFDAVIVAAAARELPIELFSRLKVGGVLVVPLVSSRGEVIKRYVKKDEDTIAEDELGPARFVPLVVPECGA